MSTDREILLFCGEPQSGKTTHLKLALDELLARRDREGLRARLLIFDPKREYWPQGRTVVEDRKNYLLALRAERFPLVVHGEGFQDWGPIAEYRDLVVVVSEAPNFCSPSTIHASFRKLLCEGQGHANIDTLIDGQRPRNLNLLVRSHATLVFALPLGTKSDRDALEQDVGMKVPDSPAGWTLDPSGNAVPLCYHRRRGEGMVNLERAFSVLRGGVSQAPAPASST